jgi:hypothetical protein
MKKTVATLSLLALAACATPQQEGPPTAFRLTSPGSFDNAMLPPKSAGNFAKNPTPARRLPSLAWTPRRQNAASRSWGPGGSRRPRRVARGDLRHPGEDTAFPQGAGRRAGQRPVRRRQNTLGMHWLGPARPRDAPPLRHDDDRHFLAPTAAGLPSRSCRRRWKEARHAREYVFSSHNSPARSILRQV